MSFNPDKDIPELTGKVILVTGGNAGLGYESILQFAKHKPQHIYLGARSAEKAATAIAQLQKDVGAVVGADKVPPITHLPLDLTSFASVKAAVATFSAAESKLDVLINNAGIMATPPGTTAEGYELQFGTNHMGHALLTRLLLPTLEATADATPDGDVRVVTLSSEAENLAPKAGVAFDDLHSDMKSYSTWRRYGQSKLANLLYTKSLAKKHPKVLFVSVHPGAVKTGLSTAFRESGLVGAFLVSALMLAAVPVSKGAWNQQWAATAPRKLLKTGTYYVPTMKENAGSKLARSVALEDRLWEWTQGEFNSKNL